MALVLGLAAAIWGIGIFVGLPHRLRWVGIGLLWLALVLAHFALPEGHPLRAATGGTAAGWVLLGGLVAVAAVYRMALGF